MDELPEDMLKLLEPSSQSKGKLDRWLTANPKIVELIDLWLSRRGVGQPTASLRELHTGLSERYGMPGDVSSFSRWLRKHRKEQYEQAR